MHAADDLPLLDALSEIDPTDYLGVLAGIRETTSAIEQAFVFPTAPGDDVLDELTALGVHEQRLGTIGPPDPRARFAHAALLTELARYQDQLVIARGEARADLYSGHRIRELVAELLSYVRRQP